MYNGPSSTVPKSFMIISTTTPSEARIRHAIVDAPSVPPPLPLASTPSWMPDTKRSCKMGLDARFCANTSAAKHVSRAHHHLHLHLQPVRIARCQLVARCIGWLLIQPPRNIAGPCFRNRLAHRVRRTRGQRPNSSSSESSMILMCWLWPSLPLRCTCHGVPSLLFSPGITAHVWRLVRTNCVIAAACRAGSYNHANPRTSQAAGTTHTPTRLGSGTSYVDRYARRHHVNQCASRWLDPPRRAPCGKSVRKAHVDTPLPALPHSQHTQP